MKPTLATFSAAVMLAIVLLLAFTLPVSVAHAADGDFDPSFSDDGLLTADYVGTNDGAYDLAIQPDGKIVAVGTTQLNGNDYAFSVMRFNPDGSEDGTFSFDGRVATNASNGVDGALGVAIQPDGKIVAVGYCDSGGTSSMALVRYNPEGTLDTSFGNGNGFICNNFPVQLTGVVIQPDGHIVASSRSSSLPALSFTIWRFNPDGTFDEFFGIGGGRIVDFFGATNAAEDVILQPDGKILATGYAQRTGNNYEVALVRLTTVAPSTQLSMTMARSPLIMPVMMIPATL